MMFAFGETVQHRRPGAPVEDEYGNETPGGWSEPVDVEGVAVDVQAVTELLGSQVMSTSVDEMPVIMPFDWEGSRADQLRVRGDWYAITGRPVPVRNPFTGTEFGTIVKLKRVEG